MLWRTIRTTCILRKWELMEMGISDIDYLSFCFFSSSLLLLLFFLLFLLFVFSLPFLFAVPTPLSRNLRAATLRLGFSIVPSSPPLASPPQGMGTGTDGREGPRGPTWRQAAETDRQEGQNTHTQSQGSTGGMHAMLIFLSFSRLVVCRPARSGLDRSRSDSRGLFLSWVCSCALCPLHVISLSLYPLE